jgi:3-oxoadipate enol-lactonase
VRLTINDIEMNYEISGKHGAPVVVLSHSLGSSSVMWEPQIEQLNPEYQVLRYDTRGHGGSEAPDGAYELDLLGDDAVGLLDALDIERVHWVGLSMGGMIGQSIVLRYPERLSTLALCDTMAVVPNEMQGVWLERIETARESGMDALADATMERWFTEVFRSAHAQAVAPIRRQFVATNVAGYIGCCEAIRRLNYLPRLNSIETPTLVVVGEHDQATPIAAADAIHEQIALSKRVVIRNAAHLSNIERHELFNTTMLDFLRRHSTD